MLLSGERNIMETETIASARKKESKELRRTCQLDKDKQHILVRKICADTDLKVFLGSNMVIHYVAAIPLWNPHPILGPVNFRLLSSL